MSVSLGTKLNQLSTFSYKSFADPSQLDDDSSTSDIPWDLNGNKALSHLPKDIPLKQLASGSPNLLDQSLSKFKETEDDYCSSKDTRTLLWAVPITLAIGVTGALILSIYLGECLVCLKGVLVSDHQRCTALGQRVLHDHGSSVDAAITAALCLGVVHPHVSGVGGGGVMLVHDINKNETRVIDFQGTAPKALTEEMLQNVSELKAGMQVGVPGMLSGLHHAHSLYGSLSWQDVVTRAAAVAKEGFNVSFSLAEAISKVKGEQLSQRFRDLFFPHGQALPAGSFITMPGLVGVLNAGVSHFYDGNISQEIEDEVQANGGVLSREDIRVYSAQVEQPVEGRYKDFIIQVPLPPSAGAALISALNLLKGFHLNENSSADNETYHWVDESVKAALAMANGLGDPKYDSSVTELLSDMLSKSQAEVLLQRVNNSHTSPPEHNTTARSSQAELTAGHVVVMGPDNLIVSVASSLSGPFGSRILTQSGLILNSLILDFSWPNKTSGQLSTQQRNRVQPGKRPLSSLMPTIVLPAWHKCGIHMALSSSSGQEGLSLITQVLIGALSSHKKKNDTLSYRRLHPLLQPNRLLVVSEFPEDSLQYVHEKGQEVQTVAANSGVLGILRKNDFMTAITLTDGFL